MVVHIYNPRTHEAEAEGSRVQSHPGLHELKSNLGYIARP
jgi:hypothetical protein